MKSTVALKRSLSRFSEAEFARFIMVGALNTVLTFLIYAALLRIVRYEAAYTVAFLTGILASYWLNARFVFRSSLNLKTALQYPLVYAAQYIAGLTALYVMVEVLGWNKLIASPATVLVTVPITFLMSRRIIKKRPSTAKVTRAGVPRG